MLIEFRDVVFGPLEGLNIAVPSHAIIGLVGEKGCGISELLRLAAGVDSPASGNITGPANRRYVGEQEPVSPSPVDLLALDHALAKYDAFVRARTIVGLERLRRAGATVLIASHHEDWLEPLCDEIWWIHEGRVAAKGHPSETLKRYRTHVAARMEAWGATLKPRLDPVSRFGSQDAEVESIELLNRHGCSSMTWKSGEDASVRIRLRFLAAAADPVVGIKVRTRIGVEAYGANTRIDGLKLGPCAAGQVMNIVFHLRCELGAGNYTLTAAAQGPDGTVQDWLEDAVGFVVVDDRPAAGIVNMHAHVSVEEPA